MARSKVDSCRCLCDVVLERIVDTREALNMSRLSRSNALVEDWRRNCCPSRDALTGQANSLVLASLSSPRGFALLSDVVLNVRVEYDRNDELGRRLCCQVDAFKLLSSISLSSGISGYLRYVECFYFAGAEITNIDGQITARE